MLNTDKLDLGFGKYRTNLLNLQQIQNGVDSFELRIWNLGTTNELVVLRYQFGSWISCNYSFKISGKDIVDSQTVICNQIKPKAALNVVNYLTCDSILKIPSQYSIQNFKDTSIENGGSTYLVEIATKNFYKGMLYNNPHVHSDSNNKQFVKLIKFLETQFNLIHSFK